MFSMVVPGLHGCKHCGILCANVHCAPMRPCCSDGMSLHISSGTWLRLHMGTLIGDKLARRFAISPGMFFQRNLSD
jgi:hypothetical protein